MSERTAESDSEKLPYVKRHTDLEVYKQAFATAMKIFRLSRSFPKEETYSLTDQIRRSSRSVCANLAEGWRKRRYSAVFVNKLSDAEAEAAETQTWLQFAVKCGYLSDEEGRRLFDAEESVICMLVAMQKRPEQWKP